MTPEESLFEALKIMLKWQDEHDENIKALIGYHMQKVLRKKEK